MDHNSQAPPYHHPHHNHHNHNHHLPQHGLQSAEPHPPPGMMLSSGNSYHHPYHHPYHQNTNLSNNTSPQIIGSNSSGFLPNNRFPFNSMGTSTPDSKPALDSINPAFSSGTEVGSSGGFAIDPSKKKRGRPRKYSPDGGNIALGLAPAPISTDLVQADLGGGTPSSEAPSSSSKKHRGRPPGSGKKQLDALGNCGVGFTPHVIFVKAGEDIASKIVAFSQQGPRTVCIMSANGSICNVTLRQSAVSDASVTYEGRFEIISLTGSFLLSESGGNQVKTGGMSISLAGPDGRVVGGGVAGMLVAATPVQIVVGSFVANGKKPKYMPSVPESRILHFGAPSSAVSPPSQEASSESSEDNTNGHLNRAPMSFNHPAQQMHNMQQQQQQQQQQMYSSMAWPNTGKSK